LQAFDNDSDDDESISDAVAPERLVLADIMGYEASPEKAARIPCLPLVAAIVALLGSLSSVITLWQISIVNARAHKFAWAVGRVGSNVVVGFSSMVKDSAEEISDRLDVVGTSADIFFEGVGRKTATMPIISDLQLEQLSQPGGAATLMPTLSMLNKSLYAVHGDLHAFATFMTNLTDTVEDLNDWYRVQYNRSAAELRRAVGDSDAIEKLNVGLTSAMELAKETSQGAFRFLGPLKNTVDALNYSFSPKGQPLITGECQRSLEPLTADHRTSLSVSGGALAGTANSTRRHIATTFSGAGVDTADMSAEDLYIERARDNVTANLIKDLNISSRFEVVLPDLQAMTKWVNMLDANSSQALEDLSRLLPKVDSAGQAIQEAAQGAVDAETKRLRKQLAQRLKTTTDSLKASFMTAGGHSFHMQIISEKIGKLREDLHVLANAVSDASLDLDLSRFGGAQFLHKMFSDSHQMMEVALLCAVGTIVVSAMEMRLEKIEHKVQDNVEDDDAMRGLAAFHPRVAEMDVELRDKLLRPFQRGKLRFAFKLRHARELTIFCYGGAVACLGLAVWSILNLAEIVFTFVFVRISGAVCWGRRPIRAFSDEVTCDAAFSVISKLVEKSVLPANGCSPSGMLICRDVYIPLSFLLPTAGLATIASLAGLLTLLFALPAESNKILTGLAEVFVDREAAGKFRKDDQVDSGECSAEKLDAK